jgi:SAM-dependent methyltransferase
VTRGSRVCATEAVASAVERVGGTVNGFFDWLRFRIDTIPRSAYVGRVLCSDHQDLPWLRVPGRRAAGNDSRWRAIEPIVRQTEVQTALDLGCNVGFFAIKLAYAGVTTIGVENHPTFYRTALYALRRLRLSNAGVLVITINPETVRALPSADAVLFLALWHHLVRACGLDEATEMLRVVWAKTRGVLFFETGEAEMPASFGLPAMGHDSTAWLTRYLEELCEGATIRHLGKHRALAPDGSECERNLFAIVRRKDR